MKKSFNLIEALAALSILSLVSVILLPAIYNSITKIRGTIRINTACI